MAEEEDTTIQAQDYGAQTYSGAQDISPQETRSSRIRRELEAEIAATRAEQEAIARERATLREDRYWAEKVEPFTVAGAPDLSFLAEQDITMGPAGQGADLRANVVEGRIADVLRFVGIQRQRTAVSRATLSTEMGAANIVGAARWRAEAEAGAEARAKAEWETGYGEEKKLRAVEIANRYGLPIEEALKVDVYMGDWFGGEKAYQFGQEGPGWSPTGTTNPWAASPSPEGKKWTPELTAAVQGLGGYLKTISPEGKPAEFDPRTAAMGSRQSAGVYSKKIRQMAEGYPEGQRAELERYAIGAEQYEREVFQGAEAPAKVNYWTGRLQEKSPEMPPALAAMVAGQMFKGGVEPTTPAAEEMFKWAREGGYGKGELLPATFPQFTREVAGEGPGQTPIGALGTWGISYTEKAAEAKIKASAPPQGPTIGFPPERPVPATDEELRPFSMERDITTFPLAKETFSFLEFLQKGEEKGKANIYGISWLPTPAKTFSAEVGGGFLFGTAKATAGLALAIPAAEYFIRRPGEAVGNVVPGLVTQGTGLQKAFQENPIGTAAELAGPIIGPWAVGKMAPVSFELTRIPTGRMETTWAGRILGAAEPSLEGTPLASGRVRVPWGFTRVVDAATGEVSITGIGMKEIMIAPARRAPEVSTYFQLMAKRPGSAAEAGGTTLAGIGRVKNVEAGTTTTRAFIGYPESLIRESTVEIGAGLGLDQGSWTRGQRSIIEEAARRWASPEDLQMAQILRTVQEAERQNLPYRQAEPLGAQAQAGMAPEELKSFYQIHSEAGKNAIQTGSRRVAAQVGASYFRDVLTSDIDMDIAYKASRNLYSGTRAIFEERGPAPAGTGGISPTLRHSPQEAVVAASARMRGGEQLNIHFGEVPVEGGGLAEGATSRIIGIQDLEGHPGLAAHRTTMESVGGPVSVSSIPYAERSYIGRLFQGSVWGKKGGSTALAFEGSPTPTGLKNIPDLYVTSRYMARTGYEASGEVISPLKAAKVRTTAGLLEDFSEMIKSRWGQEEGVPERFGQIRADILAGVDRRPATLMERVASRAGQGLGTTATADTTTLYGLAYGAGTSMADYYLRQPGEWGGFYPIPPAPRYLGKGPGEEYPTTYPRTAPYPRVMAYPRASTYPKAPEYPRTPAYPRGQEYPRSTEYPRTPEYPRTSAYPRGQEYPRSTEYPRTPEYPRTSAYPRGQEYPRTPAYPRGPVPPRTPPPTRIIIPSRQWTQRPPWSGKLLGYGELVHPIVTGRYFLGLEGRKALPPVRQWHLTRVEGRAAPGPMVAVARSRATSGMVEAGAARAFWVGGPFRKTTKRRK